MVYYSSITYLKIIFWSYDHDKYDIRQKNHQSDILIHYLRALESTDSEVRWSIGTISI